MNRLCKVIGLFVLFLFCYLIKIRGMIIPCLFRYIFNISCPMCGISRSIFALLDGNIGLSLHYNVLGIFVFIFLILNVFLLIYDFVFNKKKIEYLYNKIGNYYVLIIFIFILNMIINNVRGI